VPGALHHMPGPRERACRLPVCAQRSPTGPPLTMALSSVRVHIPRSGPADSALGVGRAAGTRQARILTGKTPCGTVQDRGSRPDLRLPSGAVAEQPAKVCLAGGDVLLEGDGPGDSGPRHPRILDVKLRREIGRRFPGGPRRWSRRSRYVPSGIRAGCRRAGWRADGGRRCARSRGRAGRRRTRVGSRSRTFGGVIELTCGFAGRDMGSCALNPARAMSGCRLASGLWSGACVDEHR
jgi:hypothetical protein